MNQAELGEQPPLSRRDFYAIFAAINIVVLLISISQGVVVTALPLLGRELGDSDRLPWVMTAFLLASTVTIPLFGKLADLIGRRSACVLALALFIAGSAACALSPSMNVLIAARTLQGLGGGALGTLTSTVLSDILAPRERPRYTPLLLISYMVGTLGGPVLGGLVAGTWGWQAIFWLNVPIGLVTVAISNSAFQRLPRFHHPGRLDVEGAVFLTIATVSLLLAISGKIPIPIAAALLLVSVAMTFVFGRWLLHSPSPLIPLRVLQDPLVRNGTLAGGIGGSVFVALTVYVPFYFQYGFHMSPSQSGVALILPLLALAVGSILGGQLMSRVRHYRRVAVVALAVSTIALAVLAGAAWYGAPLAWIETLLMLVGASAGAVVTVTTIATQNAVLGNDMGAAVAVYNFARQLTAALLVAVFGSILARAGMAAVIEGAGFSHLILAGFTWVCVCSTLMTAAALGFLLRMEERPLRSGKRPG